MLGAVATFALCALLTSLGCASFRRLLTPIDSAAQVGIGGMLALGLLGTLALPIGLFPGGVRWLLPLAILLAVFGLFHLVTRWRSVRFTVPRSTSAILFTLSVAIFLAIALVTALSPSTTIEWDALAYHLAVPKLWLETGQIRQVSFIHHSSFPFAIDNLFILGLQWGESGAKSFVLALTALGCMALFGLGRQLYGTVAARWGVIAFVGVPAVLWLSGTAYIDVPNGLYAGLGLVLAALATRQGSDRSLVWLSGLMLGLSAGSKYTGLQAILAAGLTVVVVGTLTGSSRGGLRTSVAIASIALAVGSPWYIRNVAWSGNPVYPFFYERLGGDNWSAEHARIYRAEQKTFGVGTSISKFGHAILGTAYQPGRYTNPGQREGLGNPLAAIGCALVGGMAAWGFSGKARRTEAAMLLSVALCLALWFFLSQQSRYLLSVAPVLAVLAGGATAVLRVGPLVALVAAGQAVYSGWLTVSVLTNSRLPVVFRSNPREEFLHSQVPFYDASKRINEIVPKGGKVALYDEVFGYLLDVPYFWANPGHSAEINYGQIADGKALTADFRRMGITHVYVSLSTIVRPPAEGRRWVDAMGIAGEPRPYSNGERDALMGSFEQRFVPLIAEAAAEGNLRLLEALPSGLLFEVRQP